MFDCIYRDEVKQKIKERMEYLDYARILNKRDAEILNQIKGFEKALNQIYCDIDDIRTADMQSVKHVRWVHDGGGYDRRDNWYHCSECNRTLNLICGKKLEDYPYCHCGTRMDGDAE